MEEFLEKAIQHGFSIAVAAYLLIRMDKRLEEMKNAVMYLANVIETKGAK